MGPLAPESQESQEKIPVHQLTQIAPASTARLEELHEATTKDHQLQLLVRAVHRGWPQLFKDCPHSLRPFWTFRDKITCENGILYKGAQLIMPKSERESTLKVIHMGHYAIEKMKLRAKETVYWPGITEDITNTYHQCQICVQFARSQQKETLQPVETPHTRWETPWFRHFLIARNTISSNSSLLQFVPCCQKTTESALIECNQNFKRDHHNSRNSKMHSLRWWHTIHITGVQKLYKRLAN